MHHGGDVRRDRLRRLGQREAELREPLLGGTHPQSFGRLNTATVPGTSPGWYTWTSSQPSSPQLLRISATACGTSGTDTYSNFCTTHLPCRPAKPTPGHASGGGPIPVLCAKGK